MLLYYLNCRKKSLLNYVPHLLSCSMYLVLYVFSCLTCLVSYVLSCLRCLVSYVLQCLSDLVLCVPSCLRCFMPYVLSFLTYLVRYVLLCFMCLVPYVLSCFTSIAYSCTSRVLCRAFFLVCRTICHMFSIAPHPTLAPSVLSLTYSSISHFSQLSCLLALSLLVLGLFEVFTAWAKVNHCDMSFLKKERHNNGFPFKRENHFLQDLLTQRRVQKGARGHAPSFCFFPIFCNHFFFCNPFKELKYYQNIFNTQSFVVWQRAIMLF